MVNCTTCGGTNDDNAASCSACGLPLERRGWMRKVLALFTGGRSKGIGVPVKRDALSLLTALAAQRIMPQGQIVQTMEEALTSAVRKDNPETGSNMSVKLNPTTGKVNVYRLKTVVESVEHPFSQITLSDAQQIKDDANLGDEVAAEEPLPKNVSASAVRIAKQVVLQRLREPERGRKDV